MEIFSRFPEIQAALSTKADGSCRLWPANPELDAITAANRLRFFESQDISPERVVGVFSEHEANVRAAGGADAGQELERTDGLVTRGKNLYLSLTVGDCLPIYIYDPSAKAIGLLHGGWRGLAAGILLAGIAAMRELGSDPANISVEIGPSIGPCHFEVKDEVAGAFADFPAAREARGGKTFLDLRLIAREMLKKEGVPDANIAASGECTACLPKKYFSYRRDKPEFVETMVAVIGLK